LNNIFCIVLRPSFSIDNAHSPYVRDIDYNPNRQYHLMTCGDDCRVKFWDVRKANECLKILTDHSHWFVAFFTFLSNEETFSNDTVLDSLDPV
jgi:WD40 repeat protein